MLELPLFDAKIVSDNDGIVTISLVEFPAVESNFVCFNKDEKKQMFAVENEDEHIITGVLMVADTPIYRRNGDYEYYINYSKDMIKQMSIKMLKDGTFNNISFNHDGELLPKGNVEMLEVFIKDEKKGINPSFIADVPDGSLMVSFKINDDEIWGECKNGNWLNGFSLEGYFEVVEHKFSKNIKSTITKNMSKIKDIFKKLLTSFGAVATDKGTIHYDGDADLKAGDEVFDENGDVLADGEYTTEDGKVIKVVEGKVAEIVDAEAEVADEEVEVKAEEEETVDETVEEDETKEDEMDVKAEIELIKADIEAIKKSIEELINTPATDTIEEEFSKATPKNNKYAALGEAMKNLK